VRDLSDSECRESNSLKNLQRAEIHELDEGIGYRSLMDLKPDFYTVEMVAAQVGKSPSYVKGRVSLTELNPARRRHFTRANSPSPTRWKSRGSNRMIRSVP